MGFEVALKKYALLRIFLVVTEVFLQPYFLVFYVCVAKRQEEMPTPATKQRTDR